MAKKKISELSMAELQNKIKQIKNVQFVVFALAIIYAAFMLYQMFSSSFEMQIPQVVIPLMVVFLAAVLRRQQKEVNEEIEKRQSA